MDDPRSEDRSAGCRWTPQAASAGCDERSDPRATNIREPICVNFAGPPGTLDPADARHGVSDPNEEKRTDEGDDRLDGDTDEEGSVIENV
jgi:hypothetical protein